jgi:tRNA-splicing ligase RtcB
MTKEHYHGPLVQVDECCWRIPKSYKPGMRVDGLIFADERLMEQIRKDQAPEQVANVATLPGIQLASLAMPDIHWGYGFCIGGVCATDPDEGGVISPGGVGYDINCLTADSVVLHDHGYTRQIGEMADEWQQANLACFGLEATRPESTKVCHWFGQKPRSPVLRLTTEAGDQIRATADHPFWTPEGMVPLGELAPGRRVARAPFQGVPYEVPSNEILVSEADIAAKWTELGKSSNGRGLEQVLTFLKARSLLPLRYSSDALPYLCKVAGFVFGDGNLHFSRGNGKGVVHFYGDADNLETIRADLQVTGFTPSRVYQRQRQHVIQTAYAGYQFEREEEWFKVVGSGLALLLACLGVPVGNKARQDYEAPRWLYAAPLWQKRLFLAALFGAELSSPRTVSGHDTVFAPPTLSLNKRPAHVPSGRAFLEDISNLVSHFGVKTQAITVRNEQTNLDGQQSIRLQLLLSPKSDDLLNLWGKVGFEYNRKRAGLAALAVQYLKCKAQLIARRECAAAQAVNLARDGVAPQEIYQRLCNADINRRFIERSLYEGRGTAPRVGDRFIHFKEFCSQASEGLGCRSMVWDRIASVEPADYTGDVYDFTVEHSDHNFIANSFVVSNCGVRMVRTNLFEKDVRPHLETLVTDLFRTIPTGAGQSGRYTFKEKDLNRILGEGPSFLVERGLATKRDIDFTEARGRLDGADPDAVSDRARERGSDQCGTLGSGNHFLEVQVVDEIHDEAAARVLGLAKDQVCVMIHSGSRGLGYQVCDDALFQLRGVPKKYGIELPDRQLACAPVQSSEGQRYLAAMRAAANFAFCNRQLLAHQAREVFARVFGRSWQELHMELVYDVCHNIAKFEEHQVGNKLKKVWVHRKGATRAFPPGHPEIPAAYQAIGQPVIIPGDMGRASWVLIGQPGSMARTFGTTCHGAGRVMSRTAAVQQAAGRKIDQELRAQGVIVRGQSRKGLAEEQPKAYKNVDHVVEVVHKAGISHKVARMRPVGCIKG